MSWGWPMGGAEGVTPGWHVYGLSADARSGLLGGRVVELPAWPVEIAMTVEMPGPQPQERPEWLDGQEAATAQRPASNGAASQRQLSSDAASQPLLSNAATGAVSQGQFSNGSRLGLELPGRSVLLALRAGGLAWPLLDQLRGSPVLGRVAEGRAITLPRPAELPGLASVSAERVRRHLTLAGTRGVADRDPGSTEIAGAVLGSRGAWHGSAYGLHPGGRAARHSRTQGGEVRWEVGSGADVRAAGPFGRSVQAIVTLHGNGEPELLTPPPGGALVLRAWRDGDDWQVLCAVVIAAGAGISAGRIAGRLARLAITRSWDAAALTGRAALTAARAGDPRHRLPARLARPLPAAAFQTLLAGCLQVADGNLGPATPPPPTSMSTSISTSATTSMSTPVSTSAPTSISTPTPNPTTATDATTSASARAADDNPSTFTGLSRLLEDLAARSLPSPPAADAPRDEP